jgi:hypothetical protein
MTGAPELLRNLLTVLITFDPDVIMPLLGPDPTVEFPFAQDGLPRVVQGRDDVEKFWKTMSRSFRELTVHDITTHAMVEDGLAMATWRSDGITGGRHARNNYVSLVRTSNGLIDWYSEYFDPFAGADDMFPDGRDPRVRQGAIGQCPMRTVSSPELARALARRLNPVLPAGFAVHAIDTVLD